MVQKHFPSRVAPHWMIVCAKPAFPDQLAAKFLKIFDHLLRVMFMFPDQRMDVVGHDGKSVTLIAILDYRSINCFRDAFTLRPLKS